MQIPTIVNFTNIIFIRYDVRVKLCIPEMRLNMRECEKKF